MVNSNQYKKGKFDISIHTLEQQLKWDFLYVKSINLCADRLSLLPLNHVGPTFLTCSNIILIFICLTIRFGRTDIQNWWYGRMASVSALARVHFTILCIYTLPYTNKHAALPVLNLSVGKN